MVLIHYVSGIIAFVLDVIHVCVHIKKKVRIVVTVFVEEVFFFSSCVNFLIFLQ